VLSAPAVSKVVSSGDRAEERARYFGQGKSCGGWRTQNSLPSGRGEHVPLPLMLDQRLLCQSRGACGHDALQFGGEVRSAEVQVQPVRPLGLGHLLEQ